jgi:hypothetical protein
MREHGFDMTEHHEPQLGVLGRAGFHDGPLPAKLLRNLGKGILSSSLKVYSCDEATRWMARVRPSFPHFPCCFVGWDNTARRGDKAIVMVDSSPELFRNQLALLVDGVAEKHPEERVVFINAWNEWAEGMYLEPDQKFGDALLQELASVVSLAPSNSNNFSHSGTAGLKLSA